MYFLEVYFKEDASMINLKDLEEIMKDENIIDSEYIFDEKQNLRMYNPEKLNAHIRYSLKKYDLKLKNKIENLSFVKMVKFYQIKENLNDSKEISIELKRLDLIINNVENLYKLKNKFSKYKKYLSNDLKKKFKEDIDIFYSNKFKLQNNIFELKIVDIEYEINNIKTIIGSYASIFNVSSKIEINYQKNLKIEKTIFSKLKNVLIDKFYNIIIKFSEYDNNRNFSLIFNISQDNNELVIEIIEKGISLDINEIYQKAIDLKILENNVKYSDEEIMMCIFNKSYVNSYKSYEIKEKLMSDIKFYLVLKDLDSKIKLENQKDDYFKIISKIPLKLVNLNFYIFNINNKFYGINTQKIETVFEFQNNKVSTKNGLKYYNYNNLELAYINLPIDKHNIDNKTGLLLKNFGKGYTVIAVPNILYEETLYFNYDRTSKIFMGEAFLKNGKKVNIVNIDEIINLLKG